ncbi:hypothetical protein BDV06DRAFT_116289 [Aspergillus oleicola]
MISLICLLSTIAAPLEAWSDNALIFPHPPSTTYLNKNIFNIFIPIIKVRLNHGLLEFPGLHLHQRRIRTPQLSPIPSHGRVALATRHHSNIIKHKPATKQRPPIPTLDFHIRYLNLVSHYQITYISRVLIIRLFPIYLSVIPSNTNAPTQPARRRTLRNRRDLGPHFRGCSGDDTEFGIWTFGGRCRYA